MINPIIVVLILFAVANAAALYLISNKIKEIKKQKFPKWEYSKEGIRFFNKNNEVTIETDKPLKK